MKTLILCIGLIILGPVSPSGKMSIAAFASTDASGSQPGLAPLVLSELIKETRRNNPEIESAKAEWKAAKKKILQSWALPDPMAGLDLMGDMVETRTGPQEHRFMVSQKIPFPLKLWEKRKAAKSNARAARSRYEAVERRVLRDLKKSFYELYAVDDSLLVTEEIRELLKKMTGSAEVRYANQTASQRDVAKAQAEVSLILEQIFLLRQKRESLEAYLNFLLNHGPLDSLGPAVRPVQPELKQTLTELITLAVQHRQEIKRDEALAEKSRHARNLARMANLPDLEAGFSYTVVGAGMTADPEDGKDSWMFPLQINIPLWQNRVIPAMQAARQELEAMKAKLKNTQNEVFYEVKDAYTRYETGAKIVLLYETAVIPQAQLALSSDQAGYEAGKTDFLNLLDSERVYLNAKLTLINIYKEMLKAHADLERAAGLDLGRD